MVDTHFLLENLWISESSLGILEKFQRSSDLPNIKYNCVLLFLYWVSIYDSKYIFLIDTNAKMWTEITEVPAGCYCNCINTILLRNFFLQKNGISSEIPFGW